jgi:pimeloyl-ACP methyl ester carboxylesterase
MLHYRKVGKGNPILLIHGFPNDGSIWDALVPEWSENFELIIVDLPGSGLSPLPNTPLQLKYMAEAIESVLSIENIESIVCVGHSMGGYTALELAQHYPNRIAGLSLVHAMATADNAEKKLLRQKSITLMNKGFQEKEIFLKGMSQNLFGESYARTHPQSLSAIVERGLKAPEGGLAAQYEAIMNRSDKTHLLSHASYPIQWIIGTEDKATPMQDTLPQTLIADVNFISIYEGCGHMSFMETPQQLTQDILSFAKYCHSSK